MKLSGTVSVVAFTPAIDALTERGLDVDATLRAAGLSREAVSSLENRLPHEAMRSFWESAAITAHDRSFGVHVAETLPRGAYDLFDYVFSTAATVGEGLERLTHYVRLIYDRSNLRLLVEPGRARLTRRTPRPAPQYDEFSMTLLLVRSRQASGTHWVPEHIAFQHEHDGSAAELARVFGCPVVFGAPDTELQFAPDVLRLPHRASDSRLLAILTRYADSLLTAVPHRGDLVASVSSSIAHRLAKRLPTLAATAATLHLPPRTLQRRLAESGVSHSDLVDEVRREVALKYLCQAGLGISEIAYLLHFADASAFHRAFKRWTGETPVRYRRRLFERVPPQA